MMQFWLSYNNFAERLLLPVSPAGFTVKKGQMVETVNILNVGEADLIGGERLAELTLESFMPKNWAPYCSSSSIPEPYEAIETLDRWRKAGKPIRLIITETPINMACTITSLEYGEEGGARNVDYALTLREYRFLTVPVAKAPTAEVKAEIVTRAAAGKEVPAKYVVKYGDTLWNIAKRLTGNGANWPAIYAANKDVIGKDPDLILPGQELVLPDFPAGSTAAKPQRKKTPATKPVASFADFLMISRDGASGSGGGFR